MDRNIRKPDTGKAKQMVESASNPDIRMLSDISESAEQSGIIPKILHFCFVNWKTMPELHLKYISTWINKLDESWTFVNWTPNVSKPVCEFEHYMLNTGHFAFYSDYIRCAKVYEYGGVYLDCDVMMYKDISPLLDFEYVFDTDTCNRCMECAAFFSKKHNKFLGMLKNGYENDCTENYYPEHPTEYVAPLYWRKVLKQKGINISLKSFSDIGDYKNAVSKDSDTLYTLDGTYISFAEKIGYNEWIPEVYPHTYTTHMFKGTWKF